jgi:SAM-dependent methyltransferase
MSEAGSANTNAAMIEFWNAAGGETWARFQAQLDRQFEPLGAAAIAALAPSSGETILDIGCGSGHMSEMMAVLVGAGGAIVGIDISRILLQVAATRPVSPGACRPTYRECDAQTGDLGTARFDGAFSRFGVMFFDDPVAAFANIRRALKPGGRLAFACWRPLVENAWARIPIEAARPFAPPIAPTDPHAPGPFALADPARVRGLLEAAGFVSVAVAPFDAQIGGSDLPQATELSLRVGPLGALLRTHPQLEPEVEGAVSAALSPHATPTGVFLDAAVWIVTARNS